MGDARPPQRPPVAAAGTTAAPPKAEQGAATTPGHGRSNLPALDALRALAAIAVLCSHVFQLFALRGVVIGWARAGDVGVYVFFVLSGFLISRSVLQPGRFEVRAYLIRRGGRLLPLYFLSLVLTLTLLDATPLFSNSGRIDVLVHVMLLHGLFESMRYSINGVYWTLSIEWIFYLFIALAAPLLRGRRSGWFLAIAMLLTGPVWRAVVFYSADRSDFVYFIQQLPGTADYFGAGMVMALVSRSGWLERLQATAMQRAMLLVASLVTTVAALALYQNRKPVFFDSRLMVIVWPLLLSAGLAGLIGALLVGGQRIHAFAQRSGLAFVGLVSYGIYLFHPPVIAALARSWQATTASVPTVPFVAAALLMTSILAVIFHYGVERPLMVRSRSLSRLRSRG